MQQKKLLILDWMMEAVWLLMVFALPLFFLPNIFTTFELAKVVFFEGGAVLLLLLWILKYLFLGFSPSFQWEKYWYLWLSLLALAAFYFVATFFSVAPDISFLGWYPRFQGLFTFVNYLILGMVVFFELKSLKQRERLVVVLICGLLFVCGIALLQKFLPGFLQWWNDSEFNGRIYGTLANPNYLASYIVMMVPILIVNILRKKGRIFSWLVLLVAMTALFLTLSREGYLGCFLSVLFLFIVVAYRRKAKKTLVFLALMPMVLGGFVWLVFTNSQASWVQGTPFLERLTGNNENGSSAQERLEVWPAVLRQIWASPLFGFGPETFAVTFPAFAPASVNTREDQGEILDRAHNELLDLAVQIGIPGMIAYVCFIFGLVIQGIKRTSDGADVSEQADLGNRSKLRGKVELLDRAGGKQSTEQSYATEVGAMQKPVQKNAPNWNQETWLILGFASSILGLFVANEFGFSVTVQWVLLAIFAALMLNLLHSKDFTAVKFCLAFGWGKCVQFGLFVIIAMMSLSFYWLHDINLVLADAKMRAAYEGVLALSSSGNTGQDGAKDEPLNEIIKNYRQALALAPTEPFYALNFAYADLQWLYEGQKISSVQEEEAINNAFHAARLRGYDSFSVSVAQEITHGF